MAVLPDTDRSPAVPACGAEGASSDSSSAASSIVGDVLAAGPLPGLPAGLTLPALLEGAALRREAYAPRAAPAYCRLAVVCPHHPRCQKRRNVDHRDTAALRPRAVLAYLACWLRSGQGVSSRQERLKVRPRLKDMRDWLDCQ